MLFLSPTPLSLYDLFLGLRKRASGESEWVNYFFMHKAENLVELLFTTNITRDNWHILAWSDKAEI